MLWSHIVRLPVAIFLSILAATASFAQRLIPIPASATAAPVSSYPEGFQRVGSLLYFEANDRTHGTEMWRTDGTAAGTFMLGDLLPGSFGSYPWVAGSIGETAIVAGYDGIGRVALWRSDGTAAGTTKIWQVRGPDPFLYPWIHVISADTRLFLFVWQDGLPADLWFTDGTAAGFHKVTSVPRSLSAVGMNGRLYFVAQEASVGTQLWTSDGTRSGTHMVFRGMECPGASCGPVPASLFRTAGGVCFLTRDSIWRTDGTSEGTVRLATIGVPNYLLTGAGVAYIGDPTNFWRTDGTAAGTAKAGESTQSFSQATVLDDGRLAFFKQVNSINELWTSDPASGTKRVALIPTEPSQYSPLVGSIGARIFAAGWTKESGTELWLADVDRGDAALFRDLDPRQGPKGPRSSSPLSYPWFGNAIGSTVFFSAETANGRELWASDGTADGTRMLANIAPEAPTGAISGVVRDKSTGIPARASIALCAPQCDDTASTDAEGAYRFEGVLPGTYSLSAGSDAHLTQSYDGVKVAAGFEATGIDFFLVRGGTISGTVRRAATEELLDSVQIIVRNQSGEVVDQKLAGLLGQYRTRALPDGWYFVEAHAVSTATPAADQLFDGRNCAPEGCDWRMGTAVVVKSGSDTAGIDLSLHEYGTIAGTVRDASSAAPVAGMLVQFTRTGSATASASAKSDAAGRYQSPLLSAGSYSVTVGGSRGFGSVLYPQPVELTVDGAVTGIDLFLPQALARVTGIVRDRTGEPLAGIGVWLEDASGKYVFSGGGSGSDASGRYEIFGYRSGTYYLRTLGEAYPNVDCSITPCNFAKAVGITLTEGQTRRVDMTLMVQHTVINGRVLDAVTGKPIAGVFLTVYGAKDGNPLAYPATTAAGNYTTSVISRETSFYLVAFQSGYHRTAYPSVDAPCNPTACPRPPGALDIPAGYPIGIDIAMRRFGTVSGTVYDQTTGIPIPGANIYFVSKTGERVGYAYSRPDGTYKWEDAPGPVYAYVSAQQTDWFESQIYRDKNCGRGVCDPLAGELVNAVDGAATTGIDFHLPRAPLWGRITGRVTDAETGAGIPNVLVSARSSIASRVAHTNSQGYYILPELGEEGLLPMAEYRLFAEGEAPYQLEIYGRGRCLSFTCDPYSGTPLMVSTRQPAPWTGIDFHLVKLRVTSVSPASGPVAGGTRIVVTGANFPPAPELRLGNNKATILSATPTQIVALTPKSGGGAVHVTVAASAKTSASLAQAFTYEGDAMPPKRRVAGK
jgi:ELWxxDGT repeat protein